MVVDFVLPEAKEEAAYFRGYDDGVAGLTYLNPYGSGSLLAYQYEDGWDDGVEERRYLISLAYHGESNRLDINS